MDEEIVIHGETWKPYFLRYSTKVNYSNRGQGGHSVRIYARNDAEARDIFEQIKVGSIYTPRGRLG